MDRNFYNVWYQHSKQVWWVNIHTFVANFLWYATTKNYWNRIIFSQVFASKKGDAFFETQCIYITSTYCKTATMYNNMLQTKRHTRLQITTKMHHFTAEMFKNLTFSEEGHSYLRRHLPNPQHPIFFMRLQPFSSPSPDAEPSHFSFLSDTYAGHMRNLKNRHYSYHKNWPV